MHTEIELTFPRTNWLDDMLGRVLIKRDANFFSGAVFHMFWGEHSSTFIMFLEQDNLGDEFFVVLTTDGRQEVCRGHQYKGQYIFRRFDCERESYVSPFIAAAQVIYNVM